jgi:DNA polymerase-1
MLLQIHDELVFDVPNDEIELMKTLVVETMQNALVLGDVPVLVEAGIGKNWDEAH